MSFDSVLGFWIMLSSFFDPKIKLEGGISQKMALTRSQTWTGGHKNSASNWSITKLIAQKIVWNNLYESVLTSLTEKSSWETFKEREKEFLKILDKNVQRKPVSSSEKRVNLWGLKKEDLVRVCQELKCD